MPPVLKSSDDGQTAGEGEYEVGIASGTSIMRISPSSAIFAQVKMEFLNLPEAIARNVEDGDQVALEGFTHLIPFAAGYEIIRLLRLTPYLPGSGGAREIATGRFVKQLDFLTSLSHGRTGRERRELGIRTKGPVLLVSDLCIMRPDPVTNELTVTSPHPGITRAHCARIPVGGRQRWSWKYCVTCMRAPNGRMGRGI